MKIVLYCLLLMAGLLSASAGPREESILAEKPIAEEAKAQDYRHLFRMLYFPSFPIKDYCFSIKVFLNEHSSWNENSGSVVVKVGRSDGRIVERARPLKEEEAAGLWETISGEELFSLPLKQEELLSRPFYPRPEDLHQLIFSHFDKKSGVTEEIYRVPQWSRPATRVQEALAKLVGDLVADIEAHEKSQ